MAARGAIIRRLSAVETLGSTTVICTDKTGTLTRNEMTVTAIGLPQGGPDEPQIHPTMALLSVEDLLLQRCEQHPLDPAVTALVTTAVLCNDAAQAQGADRPHGDPTEVALWVLATRLGMDPPSICRQAPRQTEVPFDANIKLMITGHRHPDGVQRLHIKGAPEAVLRLCGFDVDHPAYEGADVMAGRALRVLAFGLVEDDPHLPMDLTQDVAALMIQLKGRVQWLGLMGQMDPPREEVRPAVAACRSAGIRTVMVTGDHKLTGLAIARELGIARDGDRAVDGLELERMSETELQAALDHIAVFARVHPAQKLRIVEAFQARGEVVAMTGDGVNDAPALARADVGIAMGLTGTEVAKSAARMVITDDNFATIVSAVEQGRVVYANLKKLILYLFATALAEMLVLLLALLSGLPLPLAAVQILWINIVTEGTVTVNLVMDPPDGDEMRRPPTPRSEPLISRDMLYRVLLMTPMITAISLGWFVWRLSQGADEALVRTETFTLLALCAWFNVLNCQSATRSALRLGVLHNRWLLGGLGLSVLLQGAVLTIPAMHALFHTQPLPVTTLGLLLAAASSVLWAEELRKAWARKAFSARLNGRQADA
jgi:Ca2+-transporting ATPase